MDILFLTIISGFAAGYFVEFVSSLLERWVPPRIIKQILTFPLSLGALWLLGVNGVQIFVYACASGFVSLVVMAWVSKPIEVTQVVNRR